MEKTRKFNPLVSIIIPVYNGSNYVAEAIDSALSQTYKNVEVIVVNDGSKDEGKTEKIALGYGDKIRYFYKENGGVSSALNLGIEKMQGEYFSWLSHDDKYEPEKIERQIEILEQMDNKETVIVCSNKYIDENSVAYSGKTGKRHFKEDALIPWHESVKSIFDNGPYNGCALLIHKNVFTAVGKFNEELRYVQDMLMWLEIFLNKTPLFYSQEELVLSRIHNGQLTQTGRELFHREAKVMTEILMPKLLCDDENREKLMYALVTYNAKYNNQEVVRDILTKSKQDGFFSPVLRIKIKCKALYGRIRPFIRKIYYKVFLKVKTQ